MLRNRLQVGPGLLAAVGLLLALGAACSFQEPAQPDWNVNLQLPLVSKDYDMTELSDDVDELEIDEANGEVILNLEQSFETFEIGDRLKVDGVTKNNIVIPVSGTLRDSVTISSDVVTVDTAAIRRGRVTLHLRNTGSNTIRVYFELNDVTTPAGNALKQVIDVPPGGKDHSFSLAGYLITPPINANGENVIYFNGGVSGSTAANPIDFDVVIDDLSFAYVSGIVNELEVDIDSTEVEIDIPDGLQGFAIERASLKLAVNLGLKFPVSLDLTVKGTETRDGSEPVIHVAQDLDISGVDTIEVNDIAAFVNALPERVKITGSFVLGDGVTRSTITDEHVIETKGFFAMPLIFTLPSVDTKTEVDTLEMDEDTRDVFRDNVLEAHFHADIDNGLPVGGEIKLFFSSTRSDSTIYELDASNPQPGIDYVFSIPFRAGLLDNGTPALVTTSTQSMIRLDLDDVNLPLFYNHDTLYMGFMLTGDQNGRMVKVRPTDRIKVTASISAVVNTYVPDEDEEGGES